MQNTNIFAFRIMLSPTIFIKLVFMRFPPARDYEVLTMTSTFIHYHLEAKT